MPVNINNATPFFQALNESFGMYMQYKMRNKMFEESLQGQAMLQEMDMRDKEIKRQQMYDMYMQSIDPNDPNKIQKILDINWRYGNTQQQDSALRNFSLIKRGEIDALIKQQELAAEAGERAAQGVNERAYIGKMQELWQQPGLSDEEKQFQANVLRSQYNPENPISIPRADKPSGGGVGRDPVLDAQSRLNFLQDSLGEHYEDYEYEDPDTGEMIRDERIIPGHENIVANIKKEISKVGKSLGYDFGEPEKVKPPPPKYLEDTSTPAPIYQGLHGPPTPPDTLFGGEEKLLSGDVLMTPAVAESTRPETRIQGKYPTIQSVGEALKRGEITRATAEKIWRTQFGVK